MPRSTHRKAGSVDVEAKLQPSQRRARETYDRILSEAAELLEEVGLERISTNLVAKRADVSPAALYRYFPNKYALIVALAEKAAAQTNAAVAEWIAAGGLDTASVEEAVAKNVEIQTRVTQMTRDIPGGLWIARAMRAMPILREVANRSRDEVIEQLFAIQRRRYAHVPEADLRAAIRLSTELLSAATLMVIEDPDLEEKKITHEVCRMVALYYDQFDQQRPKT